MAASERMEFDFSVFDGTELVLTIVDMKRFARFGGEYGSRIGGAHGLFNIIR